MRRRTWIGIVAGVVLAHLGIFWLLGHKKVLPERRYIPPPNFQVRETRTLDEETGETYVYREISVSTRLNGTGPQPEASAAPVFVPGP